MDDSIAWTDGRLTKRLEQLIACKCLLNQLKQTQRIIKSEQGHLKHAEDILILLLRPETHLRVASDHPEGEEKSFRQIEKIFSLE